MRTAVAMLAPVLALTIATLPADTAWAAKGATAASKRAAKRNHERARKEFGLAKREAELGHFERAIPHFEKAYDLEKVPAILFNIGQCQRYLKDYDKALYFFEAYLREEPNAPDRKVVESDIAETRRLRDEQLAAASPPLESAQGTSGATADVVAGGAGESEAPTGSQAAALTPTEPNLDAPASVTALRSDGSLMLTAPAVTESTPVWKRWWFWAAVGGAAAAVAVTVIVAGGNHDTLVPPAGSLGTVDAR
jgi:tetratricopeptide (TPR) repeat protein